jgi:Zn-finger nucleic acid-binding protein
VKRVTDAFDDRRKALEEDYFRRKDKESLARLREALRDEAKARGESVVTMACPRCDGMLHEEIFDEVNIDRCDKCHGIWLDAGELEEIIKEENPPGRWFRVFWPNTSKAK